MKIAQTGALISLLAAIQMLPLHLNAAATAVPAPGPPPANPSQINPPKTPQPNQGTQPLLPLDIQRLRNNEVPARGTNGVLPFQPGSTNIPMEPGTNRVPRGTNAAGLTNWPSFPTNFPPVRTNVPPFATNGVPGLTNWPLWPTNWPLMGTNFPVAPTNGRFSSTNPGAGPTATNRYVQTNTINFLGTNRFIGTNPTAFPR
jgi:hypothetical protein